MAETQHLRRLVDLANEPSSERRRELLREVTDLFLEAPDGYSETERGHFGAIMGQVAREMETAIRSDLAGRLADVAGAPRNLIVQLASDAIEVAAGVLARSPALTDDDLVTIAGRNGREHLLAMTQRSAISTRVSDAIVAAGDDDVLESLVRNEGAALSREAMETIVERAETNERLHAPVIARADLPADLMNEMFFVVSAELKKLILERNAGIDPAELDAALNESRRRMTRRGARDNDPYRAAEAYVDTLERSRQLNEQTLIKLLRQNQRAEFVSAFARLTGLDPRTARRIVMDRRADGLAIAAKAARFDRATFSTIVLLVDGRQRSSEATYELLGLYDRVPAEVAQRVMRFWRVRKQALDDTGAPAGDQRLAG